MRPGPNARPLDAPTALPLTSELVSTPQAMLLPYSAANWAQVSNARPLLRWRPLRSNRACPPASTPAVTPVPPAAPAATGRSIPGCGRPTARWLGRFGAAGGKGIDIVGARNAPVKAVAPGKVVYSGSGLRGYGRLLIVKHSGEFLSAYAHNETILVKEGDTVTAGQKIALMGDSDADRVKLHFEIRRYGKPLDPLNYLPERS